MDNRTATKNRQRIATILPALLGLAWAISLAQAVEFKSVTLAWDPNTEPDIAGYRIYYGSPSGTYDQTVDVGAVTVYTIDNLIAGVTYSFRATCYNLAGLESEPSNSVDYLVPKSIPASNQQPIADPLFVSTSSNTPLDIFLTGSDPEADPLTFHLVNGPSHGSLSGDPPQLTYLPNHDYSGPDSFSFLVNDGSLDSDPALVSITVTPIEDPGVPDPDPDPEPDPHPPIHIVRVTPHAEGVLLTWTSVADATYQLLHKNSLADPEWLPLTDPITASGPETTHVDHSLDPQPTNRYYAVRLIE